MKNTCWIVSGEKTRKDGGKMETAQLFACNGTEKEAREYAKSKLRFERVDAMRKMN